MHVLPTETGMLAPGICVVCELAPVRDQQPVVDTLRELYIGEGLVTHLSGRKYLCQPCIVSAFNALLASVPAEA